MNSIQPESTHVFINFILWGIFILFLFLALRFAIPYVVRNKKQHAIIKQYLMGSEIIAWLFYLYWFIFRFLESRSFFVIVVFAILLFVLYAIGRLWLFDMIAGIIFKSGRQFNKGDYIEKDEYKGIVAKLGSRFVVLESFDGNLIHIPYHKITSSIFKRNESIDQKSGYTFELMTGKESNYEEKKADIEKSILSLPWSSIQQKPVIHLMDQTNESFILKLTVYAIDKSFASKIESQIKKLYDVK